MTNTMQLQSIADTLDVIIKANEIRAVLDDIQDKVADLKYEVGKLAVTGQDFAHVYDKGNYVITFYVDKQAADRIGTTVEEMQEDFLETLGFMYGKGNVTSTIEEEQNV